MKLNKYIDHTILKPSATVDDIKKLCADAARYDFASVCVNPCHVKLCHELLKETQVNVCTVIGFPLGANTTQTKVYETQCAYDDGCDEFDMVINVGALKAGDLEFVKNDIKAVVEASKGRTVKVIIETFYLTDEEKITATKLAVDAGADFVKTCTGFNEGKATVHDVAIMHKAADGKAKIKASAGIRDLKAALELVEAGAERLGTSAGVAIIEG